ncbi:DUF6286 domain-containing protein [Devriesea agamarum]|uniref:DUF6286 domain-containing protein n=1 Tax=Devriesea agamarum TaxID=472569 RepID=UPI00071D8569|nr:DUF6286 domain-containing protein [Devriesea agamarum]
MKAPSLLHRPYRSIPMIILGIILLLIGILVCAVSISMLSKTEIPSWITSLGDQIRALVIDSPAGWTIAIVLVCLGLICLLAGIIPGARSALELSAPDHAPGQQREIVIPPRDLEQFASASAQSLDGVTSARATCRGRRMEIRVQTPLHESGDLGDRIQKRVQTRLDGLGLVSTPRVRVRIRTS